jgi:BioD-like phosphotransacetylase family protein
LPAGSDFNRRENILELIKKTDFPLILVKDDTYTATSKITSLNFKIKAEDSEKVKETQNLIEEYVDVDEIYSLLKK